MRINRYLARSGVASRRKAEELILAGKVLVNGEVVTKLATEIDTTNDKVEVGGKIIKLPEFKYYALNKPKGYTTTKSDPHAEHTIFELLPKDDSLIAVGRLDRETTGLILITNDGDFAQNIIHPAKKIQKHYLVTATNSFSDEQIQKLGKTIQLDDGPAKAVSVKQINEYQIVLAIEEGRNRIVRRMIAATGNKVAELERIQIGHIWALTPLGKFRELTKKEIEPYV